MPSTLVSAYTNFFLNKVFMQSIDSTKCGINCVFMAFFIQQNNIEEFRNEICLWQITQHMPRNKVSCVIILIFLLKSFVIVFQTSTFYVSDFSVYSACCYPKFFYRLFVFFVNRNCQSVLFGPLRA